MSNASAPEMPHSFFKFVTIGGGLVMLRTCSVGYRRANDLNDVFELLPAVTHHTAEGAKLDHAKVSWTEEDARYSTERYDQLAGYRERVEAFASMHAVLSVSASLDTSVMIDVDSGHSGDPRRNLLLWAYYAEGGKGLALEFSRALFLDSAQPRAVQYDKFRPQLTFEDMDADPDFPYLHKSEEWRHETEWRALLPIVPGMIPAPAAETLYPVPFSPNALRSITVGCRVSDANVNELRTLLACPWFQHVKLYFARAKHDRYALDFRSELDTFSADGSLDGRWSNAPENGVEMITIEPRP